MRNGPDSGFDPAALRAAIVNELEGNLLPFWRRRIHDPRGDLIAEMSGDGAVAAHRERALILLARLVWTFSALYGRLRDERDLELARQSASCLDESLHDRRHGGYHWRVAADGRTVDDTKKTYGQAFAIYALSELHRATGDEAPLATAGQLMELVEKHARDDHLGGYLEARAADWTPAAELRLSSRDLEAAKSMNTHLHLLEAYTSLYRSWPDELLAVRLGELLDLFQDRILDPESGHLRHFFDLRWRPLAADYSYGHDIEAAWLLVEAATALGDGARAARAATLAIVLGRAVLGEGLDAEGGLAYGGRDGRVSEPYRDWWCQAEAVVGFWEVYRLTGDPAFAEASSRVWSFIERRVVDRRHGEWFWRIREDGSVDSSQPKVSRWKGPYHNVRMCLEMMRRLGGGNEESEP